MQSVKLSGGFIAYRQQGHGPPLLLLHGWGGSSRYWKSTLQCLADRRTVYALDLPGYGDSPPWTNGHATSIQSVATLVIEFADALGLDHFDLNGHSLSSSVSVYVAVNAPARVRRLVLTCASTYRNELERLASRYLHRLLGLWIMLRRPWMGHSPWIYRPVVQRFFYRSPPDHIMQASFDDFLRMDRRTAIAHANDAIHGDYHAVLRQVAAPTLLIGARHDNVMPTSGTPCIARLIPNCQLSWIERCGHLPMIERPAVYHQLLREFLLEG